LSRFLQKLFSGKFGLNSEIKKLSDDIQGSLANWRLWIHLGWNDVAKQYRRSFLGPIWITLNTGIFIVAFSMIGAQLFNQNIESYLAFFATGNIVFTYLSLLVSEGCSSFTGAESYLKQGSFPKLTFVFRTVVRNIIMLAHNAVIILCALLWVGKVGSIQWIALGIGLIFSIVAGFFIIAILGAIAARYRDVPMMITSAVQVLYFLTPVMWRPEQLTERAKWLVILNPMAIYLDLIRKPLLGEAVSTQTYLSGLLIILLLAGVCFPLYVSVRRKIVYWL
jgi:lipopolysaccharide transport system permease protein